ncbi:MAG: alkaline phosphatase family protein, partial [Terriglobia bacterium]
MRTRIHRSESSRRVLQRTVLLGLGMVIAIMPLGRNALPKAQAAGGSAPASAPPHGMEKIQHVIWIIQENHSFDNYFGTFPHADGIPPS